MSDNKDPVIDYDLIVTNQLRAVVPAVLRKVLEKNANATEIPSPHYFYISFNTRAPGVVMPSYLKSQYPEEMTVVLQYQFWNLVVTDKEFSVVLSFGKTPAAITIPYQSIVQFSDPAVNFMLRFDDEESEGDAATPTPPLSNPHIPHKQSNLPLGSASSHASSHGHDVSAKQPSRGATPPSDKQKNNEAIDGDPAPTSNVVSLAEFRRQRPHKK